MSELKKGDTVQLKIGGPKMNVQKVGMFEKEGIEDGVECVWFDKDKPMKRVFDRAVLQKEMTREGAEKTLEEAEKEIAELDRQIAEIQGKTES